ncbi:MAG: rhomboid family intramembrane serine protease [Flavobacteriales bacterium CG11_big_fil_rev_8_21_14_0_20_35_7]|nr:MAG: rhomboid family intramembrane serine protease [Flavobacteriales bacterium CG11_big_fil_rev_8_21_14_0_20_35_7]
MIQLPPIIKNLIIINVIFFVATFYVFDENTLFEWFALFYPQSPYFHSWQVVTHMFMHGGFMHILFNMYALYAFGSPLEQMWGGKKFLFFYFSAGLGAAAIFTLANFFTQNFTASAVGASGAIYGILVAFGMTFPDSKLALIFFPVPISAKYFIPVLILSDLFFGFTGGDNIAHFAHIGGALFGFIIMLFWKQNQFKRWDH